MLASGSNCYRVTSGRCIGNGVSWTQSEFEDAINGPVISGLFDDEGMADIEALLSSLPETEFEQDELARILAPPDTVEDWRVGEAIAEVYLGDHRDCLFPWPDGRDVRKDGSSLPGADLVGICTDRKGVRFSFGEVKTSKDKNYPPGVVYGRSGLEKQLEDLRDDFEIRKRLMTYLGFRAARAPWQHDYQAASKRFLADNSDVQLFGVLIRDVPPDEKDIKARVRNLASNCPSGTAVELLALYIPIGEVSTLAKKAIAASMGSRP